MEIDYKALELDEKSYKALLLQCQTQISVSEEFMGPKWALWNKRLKLLNNQTKDETALGDTTVHVHFNTIHASLYDDEVSTTFVPRSQGDLVVTENLNPLYAYDCELMNKDELDYDWIWNTLFFSRSLVSMLEFDRELMVPKPEVINMLTWYRDPNALSVNGKGAMRFGGFPSLFTLNELERSDLYVNLKNLVFDGTGNKALTEANEKIKTAQGFVGDGIDTSLSDESQQTVVMDWLTIFRGKRVLVSLTNQNTRIIRFKEFKDQDEWGIVDQTLHPNSLSWDGTSVLDLVEDKQRMKAKLANAAAFIVETNANHMSAYDLNKIHNESDLDFEQNKHIAVDGNPNDAIVPINRQQVSPELQWMLSYTDRQAQTATGATEIQQGSLSGGKKTATEIATVSDSVDTRFSLSAKVIGWSEKRFARYWYKMYKMYFMDKIDEKIMRITGANGVFFQPLKKEDIMTSVDPNIMVNSRIVGEAKRIREIQDFVNMFDILIQDPSVKVNELVRMRAKLGGLTELQMNVVFKPDAERIMALGENEKLNKNKFVPILESDDDMKHIQEHGKASDGKSRDAHIKAHYDAYLAKNKNPKIKAELEEAGEGGPQGDPLVQGMDLSQQNSVTTQSVMPA